MGLGKWLFGNVGSKSAGNVVNGMHSATEQVLHRMAQATDSVTKALDANAELLRQSLFASTAVLRAEMAANVGALSSTIFVGSAAIAVVIGVFAVVHWYSNRPDPDARTMRIESTIEIQEADGTRTRSHTVVEGPAPAMQGHLRMVGAQTQALVLEAVQPGVRQQVQTMIMAAA